MRLRVCDGERERTAPASLELVESAFAVRPVPAGYEVGLSDGERWIAAVAVDGAAGEGARFLLSGVTAPGDPPSGRVSHPEALKRFREFILQGAPAQDQLSQS